MRKVPTRPRDWAIVRAAYLAFVEKRPYELKVTGSDTRNWDATIGFADQTVRRCIMQNGELRDAAA